MKIPDLYLVSSFLAFARARNMQHAAAHLGLSQPALTSHLKQFEDAFSQDVFSMQGRRKILTDFGKRLFQHLDAKFGNLEDELRQMQTEYQSPEKSQLVFAGRTEVLSLIAGRIDFPGTLIFQFVDGAQAVENLIHRKADLGISNHLEEAMDLQSKKLFTDHFCILFPRKWNISGRHVSRTLLEELCQKKFISYKTRDPNLENLLQHYQINGPPRFGKIIANWSSIAEMVESGQGWSLVPSLYIANLRHVQSLPLEGNLANETHFYLLYRKELRKLAWFKDFSTALQDKF